MTIDPIIHADVHLWLPLGIIGLWRWSVWLLKKIVALFYQPPQGQYQTTISIITPVYNEDPAVFQAALESWKANQPDEIIAVIDYTDKTAIDIFEKFSKKFSSAKLIITQAPGKRPALATGVRAAGSEIVALVDSDTIWEKDLKNKILGPFHDWRVAGVGTRQDLRRTDTLARRLFKIRLDIRYTEEMPFLAVCGQALTCLSGRTAVYRRNIIIDLLDDLVSETFWGVPAISGDDKCLTHLVQEKGWHVKYVAPARVYTIGAPDLKTFLQQQLRWARNSWRADLKAIFKPWPWREAKVLALFMLDRFIQPFTLLLGPFALLMAILFQQYQIAIAIVTWWLLSRTIKIYSHLKEKPLDILIVPIFIVFTFVIAVLKIYALVTINKQGWITRWDQDRLAKRRLFARWVYIVVTICLIAGPFMLLARHQIRDFEKGETKQQKIQNQVTAKVDRKQAAEEYFSSQQTQTEFFQTKQTKWQQKFDQLQYGFYQIKRQDTWSSLQRKFNLTPEQKILNAKTLKPINPWNIYPGQQIAIAMPDLANPFDQQQLANQVSAPAQIQYQPGTNTINVFGSGSVVNLTTINQGLPANHKQLLEQTKPKEWLLRANLFIGENVLLVIDGNEVAYLKMKSQPEGFVWLKSENGGLLINQTKITSWNETTQRPDLETANGRSFIIAKKSGRMDISHSEIAYLGSLGVTKRGGEFGGSYGLSWKITNGRFKNDLLTGSLIDSQIHDNYFGVYFFGATGVVIKNNQVYHNIAYGIDPHDDSNNLVIENNRVWQNGTHGIIASKRCFHNFIRDNYIYQNTLHGIMLDRQSNGNLVENNQSDNNHDGLAINNSSDNLIRNNNFSNNHQGIRLNNKAYRNQIVENKIDNNVTAIHFYDQVYENLVDVNQLVNNNLALSLGNTFPNFYLTGLDLSENKKQIYIYQQNNQSLTQK